MYKIDDYGMCCISDSITHAVLSFNPIAHKPDGDAILVKQFGIFIQCFNHLSNLNRRDNELAQQLLNDLHSSTFYSLFPNMVTGLLAWASGKNLLTRKNLLQHIEKFPHDVIGIHIIHMFDFLHGNRDGYLEYFSHKNVCDNRKLNGYYQGMYSFSFCEHGKFCEVLDIAKSAATINLDDIYSLHALVHCYHSQGKHETVIDFLEENKPFWLPNPGMNMHIYWHLALSYLETGNLSKSLQCFRDFILLKSKEHDELDLDAANYLVRYFFIKQEIADIACEIDIVANNWAPSIFNSLSYFNDMHAAMAFMLSGGSGFMAKLENKPLIPSLDMKTNNVGKSIILAISAYMSGEYAKCADLLGQTKDRWHFIGGSIAQREILNLMLKCAQH
ncbi:MAG: hypothetical protein OXU88_08280 [Gammaproteobacteria bacterium]|nr:hypothetical protein [Gammaproteobacteria bacterium]